MSLTSSSVRVTISALYSAGVFGDVNPQLMKPDSPVIATGTGANQADLSYAATRTITNTGTPDSIDLTGGGLLTPENTAFNAVKIITIVIVNLSTAQILTVGGGSNPLVGYLGGTTPTKVVGKSGIFFDHCPTDGYTVTAGTADKIQVATDGGTNVNYLVFLLARSA